MSKYVHIFRFIFIVCIVIQAHCLQSMFVLITLMLYSIKFIDGHFTKIGKINNIFSIIKRWQVHYTNEYMRTYAIAYIYIYICVCVCAYIYVCVCTYIYIYHSFVPGYPGFILEEGFWAFFVVLSAVLLPPPTFLGFYVLPKSFLRLERFRWPVNDW